MKVCVIGAGPSGLYATKYLSYNNVMVDVFEKETNIGGMYNYSFLPASKLTPFKKIVASDNVNLYLGSEITQKNIQEMEKFYDAFIISTGAQKRRNLNIPGSHYCIDALDLIKKFHSLEKIPNLGDKILIIGMGNVSMDLCKYLFKKPSNFMSFLKNTYDNTSITITSRSNVNDSAFSNSELREVLEIPNVKYKIDHKFFDKKNEVTNLDDKLLERRKRLLKYVKDGSNKLKLLFNTNVEHIKENNGMYNVTYKTNGEKKTENFTSVISSLGFENEKNLKFNSLKPIYYIGWANNPKGNIATAEKDAMNLVESIIKEIEQKTLLKQT